jgi:hypothetical protein
VDPGEAMTAPAVGMRPDIARTPAVKRAHKRSDEITDCCALTCRRCLECKEACRVARHTPNDSPLRHHVHLSQPEFPNSCQASERPTEKLPSVSARAAARELGRLAEGAREDV